MTIEPLDLDAIKEAQPMLNREDVEDLPNRDKKMVFHAAKLEQQQLAVFEILVTINQQLMRMEAGQIRERIQTAHIKTRVDELEAQAKVWKRVFVLVGGAALIDLVHFVFVKIFGGK